MDRVFARIGEQARLTNGKVVVLERRKTPKPERPRGVIGHELAHAFADQERVTLITIIPGPGYSGATFFSGPVNPKAAAAPHAYGYDGTSYDLALIESEGHSVSAAVSAARGVLEDKEEEMDAAATALVANGGTLGGSAFRHIIANVKKGPELVLRIISPNGAEEVRTIENHRADDNDFVQIPIELREAA